MLSLLLDTLCTFLIILLIWWCFKKGFLGIILEITTVLLVIYTYPILYLLIKKTFNLENYEFTYFAISIIYYYIISIILHYFLNNFVDQSILTTDHVIGTILGIVIVTLLLCFTMTFINFIYNMKSSNYNLEQIIYEYLTNNTILYNKLSKLLFEINKKNLPNILYNSIFFTNTLVISKYIILKFFKNSFKHLFINFLRYINI